MSKCKYCEKEISKTPIGDEFIKAAQNIDNIYYCSQQCYDTAWQILSALYEHYKHDTQKTWNAFKEAVWGESNA